MSAKQNPCYTSLADAPEGVPISAILFGGRRRELAPLIFEARNWRHGVLVGASMASETTAAATGQVGVVRRDPMAMKPFCGYEFGSYWQHWLSFERRARNLPRIFHVNWFRQDKQRRFMWPGFGENLRVLKWVLERCAGRASAKSSPIGYLPRPQDLDLEGLQIGRDALNALLSVDPQAWHHELIAVREYLDQFHTPLALYEELHTSMDQLHELTAEEEEIQAPLKSGVSEAAGASRFTL